MYSFYEQWEKMWLTKCCWLVRLNSSGWKPWVFCCWCKTGVWHESDNQSSDCLLFKRGCWGLEPMLGVCHRLSEGYREGRAGTAVGSLMDRSHLKQNKTKIPTLEVKPGEKNNLIYQNEDSEKCLICLLKEEVPGKERHAKYPIWKALQMKTGDMFLAVEAWHKLKIKYRLFCLQIWGLQN